VTLPRTWALKKVRALENKNESRAT
jgi:hypothetical protein